MTCCLQLKSLVPLHCEIVHCLACFRVVIFVLYVYDFNTCIAAF